MITRGDITGALKVLNANGIHDRKKHLQAMLEKDHVPSQVEAVLSDLVSYPDWNARLDLEVPAPTEGG